MASARPTCSRCLRPEKTCICPLACEIDSPLEVVILQHPLETTAAKGTARLLHLCLKNSLLIRGETFEATALEALLAPDKLNLLLYPGTAEAPAQTLDNRQNCAASNMRLVVLDGTWRKSRKLLHLNPLLAELPRFTLPDSHRSGYRIRKAQADNQLSTFEAATLALRALDQGTEDSPVDHSFNRCIDQQLAFQGRH